MSLLPGRRDKMRFAGRGSGPGQGACSNPQAGSAVLIVLVLLSLMGVLFISNGVVLRRLKVELQMLEQKHNRRLQEQPAARVAPQAAPAPPPQAP